VKGRPGAGQEALVNFGKGNALLAQRRMAESVACYERSLALNPAQPDAHNNLGLALTSLGRTAEAIPHYQRALSLDPRHFQAHSNLGVIAVQQGRIADAVGCYQRALAIQPNHAETHNNLGVVFVQLRRFEEAIRHYRRATEMQPGNAEMRNNLGVAFWEQGRLEEAIVHHTKALAIQPNHAGAHNCLGNVFKLQGKFGDALLQYDLAIAIQPDFAEAHFSRSELKTFQPEDGDLNALEKFTAAGSCPPDKAPFFHFAAAKAREDCGEYERAFEHFRNGNQSKRRQIHYNEAGYTMLFERIRATFDSALLDRLEGPGDPSSAPIFVLGMPRSGSTLVEQILSSHPRIHGAGELDALHKAISSELAAAGATAFPDWFRNIDGAAARRLGQAYLSHLPVAEEGKVRIVDKMPDNFPNIGIIRLALPNARIIHTMRQPMDTCWSCYSKLFTFGQNFSYDLGELGRYYRRYEETMSHWRSVLPAGAMLEVSYEDVVDDLEGQARRLIEFCGLEWDDRCLSFHENGRTVKTASTVQVRQRLYRTSMQRWRPYEAWLGPLLRELGEKTDVTASPTHMHGNAAFRENRIACTA
jgi:Flp pilus assembly protein TadD